MQTNNHLQVGWIRERNPSTDRSISEYRHMLRTGLAVSAVILSRLTGAGLIAEVSSHPAIKPTGDTRWGWTLLHATKMPSVGMNKFREIVRDGYDRALAEAQDFTGISGSNKSYLYLVPSDSAIPKDGLWVPEPYKP